MAVDLLAITGMIVAFVAIAGGQYLEGGELTTFLNGPAILLVLGGTIGAVMLQTPFSSFKKAFKILRWVFVPPQFSANQVVEKIVEWSKKSRKKGLLSLEDEIEFESDGFSNKGLTILVDGYDVNSLRRILEVELDTQEQRDLHAAQVFESMGGYSPTIGIIGAVLGLIEVMGNLSDPSELGAGIAVAFVATIYGVGLANLLFLPIANKLKTLVYEQSRHREMVLEGLVAIAEGQHPKVIETKLYSFINMK